MKNRPLCNTLSRLGPGVVLILTCLGVSMSACAANGEMSVDGQMPVTGGIRLDLMEFVSRTLVRNDQALDIRDSLESARLDTAIEADRFTTELVPLVNYGASTAAGTLGMGMEARRNSETGTAVTVGFLGERVTSDNFAVENSHIAKAYVRVSQGLFRRWGREYNRIGLTVAELEEEKNRFLADSARQDLILSAVRAYYQAVLGRHLVEKTGQALARRKAHLEAARSRQSLGLVSMADVYRAELAELDMETSLKDQERAYALSIDSLYELLAVANSRSLVLDEEITQMAPVLMEDWKQQILEYQPDWHAHLIDRRIGHLSQFKAERDVQPDISLELLLEQQGLGSNIEQAKDLDETNWSVQLRLDSPLGKSEKKISVQRERLRSQRVQREGEALKRHIVRDAQQAFDDLKTADRRYGVSRERLVQAQKGHELAEIRYNRGISSNLEVLDSESAFTNAELDILRTLIDYNIAAVRLAHAVGILDLEWLKASLVPVDNVSGIAPEYGPG